MTRTESGFLVDDDDIAEPWRRLVGFMVDFTALVMIDLVIIAVAGIDLDSTDPLRLPASVLMIRGFASAVYYIGFTMYRGQTPGKVLTGTRVVMRTTAEIPGLGPSGMRWLIPGFFVFLPGVPMSWVVIYGWLLFDVLRRGLHDKVARTVVTRAR